MTPTERGKSGSVPAHRKEYGDTPGWAVPTADPRAPQGRKSGGPEIVVNDEVVGRGAAGMRAALGAMVPAMGDGGPCLSCGGNDGYGPPPHHAADCYFASAEDADA